MFISKNSYSILSKVMAIMLVCLFLVSSIAIAQPSISTLAPLAASENPKVKREITASMYRASRLIWLASSPRYLDLLSRYNALALLLPSGKYLMTPETASNDLNLIRSATHEDNEILMQQEEKLHPTRYNRLMRQTLDRDDIMKPYRVLSHYKESNKQSDNIIFNDLIAKAFEILFVTDEGLIYPDELRPEEKEFVALIRPILEAKDSIGRYKNFSQVFFDSDKRTKAIKALQENKDERFYRVADSNKTAEFTGPGGENIWFEPVVNRGIQIMGSSGDIYITIKFPQPVNKEQLRLSIHYGDSYKIDPLQHIREIVAALNNSKAKDNWKGIDANPQDIIDNGDGSYRFKVHLDQETLPELKEYTFRISTDGGINWNWVGGPGKNIRVHRWTRQRVIISTDDDEFVPFKRARYRLSPLHPLSKSYFEAYKRDEMSVNEIEGKIYDPEPYIHNAGADALYPVYLDLFRKGEISLYDIENRITHYNPIHHWVISEILIPLYGQICIENFINKGEVPSLSISFLEAQINSGGYTNITTSAIEALAQIHRALIKQGEQPSLAVFENILINGRDFEPRLTVAESLGETCDPLAVELLIKARKVSADVHTGLAIDKGLKLLLSEIKVPKDIFNTIVDAKLPLWAFILTYKNNPELFEGHPFLILLIKKINQELENVPHEVESMYLDQFSNSIELYLQKVDVASFMDENAEKNCKKISSLLDIVHINLPLCLHSLCNIGFRIEDVAGLMRVLPFNNPLTRIIRMLGESEGVSINGYEKVVSLLIQKGQFQYFYQLILKIAKEKQRAAPQEVAGALDVLTAYQNNNILQSWRPNDWEDFSRDIHAYYDRGFKVITLSFFSYFRQHQNDVLSLDRLKADIENELKDLAWGNFFGLSNSFKEKYGLSTLDEIAILSKFFQITNLGGKDYERAYNDVKAALAEKGPQKWQEEISASLRMLYSLNSTRSVTAYQPGQREDTQKLGELIRRLSSYMAGTSSGYLLKDLLNARDFSSEKIKFCILDLIVPKESRPYYQTVPQTSPDERTWLSSWHTLLADTFKIDYKITLEQKIREVTEGDISFASIASAEERLSQLGFKFSILSQSKKLFSIDGDLKHIVSAGDESELINYFQRKWLPQIRYEDIENERVFKAWLDNGWNSFIRHLASKIKKASEEIKPEKIREAIYAARAAYLSKPGEILSVKKAQYAHYILDQLMHIFSEDIEAISGQLNNYHEVSVPSRERLITGLFDDLLHLTGEFIMTGVCTWNDRADQVRNGESKGYHFATIALKDEAGRVLGFSQVQILKVPLQGADEKSNEGYRVLSLTGINLSKGEIAIDRRKAIHAILKTAYELSKKASFQGAVLVYDEGIHSNQPDVKSYIKEAVRLGYLKESALLQNVELTNKYHYQKVYVIEDIPDTELMPASREDIFSMARREERLLEQKYINFSSDLGHVIYKEELSEQQASLLKDKIEEILNSMPKAIIESLRLYLSWEDVAFNVYYMPSIDNSTVNRSEKEITIYLGKDAIGEDGAMEPLRLREILSEAVASFVLHDYAALKETAKNNENAYFKLELVKMLLNYQAFIPLYHKTMNRYKWNPQNYWDRKTPEERRELGVTYKKDLDKATKSLKGILQWNLFLNTMDDADPQFMILDYIHALLRSHPAIDEKVLRDTILAIAQVNVSNKVSIIRLRNVLSKFLFDGAVKIKGKEKIEDKESFENFGDMEDLAQLQDVLLTTQEEGFFYRTLRTVIGIMLPLDEEALNKEMVRISDNDLFRSPHRENAIREVLREILVRRIGGSAYEALTKHLTANRGNENIPYIETLPPEIELVEGDDADNYQFLKYVRNLDESYRLLSNGKEDSQERDWVSQLFLMTPRNQSGEDNTTPGSPLGLFTLLLDENRPLKENEIKSKLGRASATLRPDILALVTHLGLVIGNEQEGKSAYELTPEARKNACQITPILKQLQAEHGARPKVAEIKAIKPKIDVILKLGKLEEAFSTLNSETRKVSQLGSSVSRMRGTSQNLMEVKKFRFCLPIEVLRNSPDIALALSSTGLLKQKPQDAENIEFELVVTGVTEEDVKIIDGLNRDDIKKTLNLPKRFTVSIITEAQIQKTAQRFGYDASNPKNRVAIVKDFFSGALAKGEYMAIATDALDTAEKADALKEELEREFKVELSEENISIRVLVRPESGKSMYSLSKIINGWLEDINQGNFSTISRILPIPAPLTPELEKAIKQAWVVLTAA